MPIKRTTSLAGGGRSRMMADHMSGKLTQTPPAERSHKRPQQPQRVVSVDALRGLVMFAMIFVNDLAGAGHVPAWMKHYHGPNGMTFVDMVFPAFLFIVGMSIPLAMNARLQKPHAIWGVIGHVLARTVALLAIGIMMVNSESDDTGPAGSKMFLSANWWRALMFLSAILSFSTISPGRNDSLEEKPPAWARITLIARLIGITLMVYLALTFRAPDGGHLLRLSPFFLRPLWYGILGIIGWAYLVSSLVYLIFGNHRTALLGCAVLVMSLYSAGIMGAFHKTWMAHHIDIASALGSHPAIAVAGVLLGSILVAPDTTSHGARILFTTLFVAGFAAAAVLLSRQWGISKEAATPSWALWACAMTGLLWLWLYLVSDVLNASVVLKPLATAGQNVLLAYLLSEMMESVFSLLHIGKWYDRLAEPNLTHAIIRSAGCAVVILVVTALINRVGFRVKI